MTHCQEQARTPIKTINVDYSLSRLGGLYCHSWCSGQQTYCWTGIGENEFVALVFERSRRHGRSPLPIIAVAVTTVIKNIFQFMFLDNITRQ